MSTTIDDTPAPPLATLVAETIAPPAGIRALASELLRSPVTVAGLVVIVVLLIIAIAGPSLAPQDPLAQSFLHRGAPPSAAHWLGTDRYGRDTFSRVLIGTRWSLALGLGAPLIAGVIGTLVGAVSGFFGGWTDRITSRVTDMLMAFPALLLGIMIAAALGPGFGNLVGAVSVAFVPRFIRVARAATLTVRREPYIEASFAAGQHPLRIVLKHVLPNISGPIVVVGTLWIATAIRIEATLSFIGLGVQAPAPSWGNIVRDGLTDLLGSPWPVISAGAILTLCVLAFNIVGDAVRDVLDPEYRE
jgi:peptide/nickel transport system permease protein